MILNGDKCTWKETTLSLPINVQEANEVFTATPSYTYPLQTTDTSQTLICPLEFNHPSPDKDY